MTALEAILRQKMKKISQNQLFLAQKLAENSLFLQAFSMPPYIRRFCNYEHSTKAKKLLQQYFLSFREISNSNTPEISDRNSFLALMEPFLAKIEGFRCIFQTTDIFFSLEYLKLIATAE